MSVLINNPNSTCRCILGLTTAGFLAGGGLGAIGSAIGGIFGGIGQAQASKNYLKGVRETNATNLQIAQETNAQNYKVWQEEQQHNIDMYNMQKQNEWDMWNAENAYNSASAQRQRLEDAGYNPYLAIGGMSGNLASGMTNPAINATHPPTMQGATMQAPGIEGYYNGLQAAGSIASGVLPIMRELSEIDKINSDIDESRERTRGHKIDNDFNKETFSVRKKGLDLLNDELQGKIDLLEAQESLESLRASAQQTLNRFLPFQQKAELTQKWYSTWASYQSGRLSSAQAANEMLKSTLLQLQIMDARQEYDFRSLYGYSDNWLGQAFYQLKRLLDDEDSGFNTFLNDASDFLVPDVLQNIDTNPSDYIIGKDGMLYYVAPDGNRYPVDAAGSMINSDHPDFDKYWDYDLNSAYPLE